MKFNQLAFVVIAVTLFTSACTHRDDNEIECDSCTQQVAPQYTSQSGSVIYEKPLAAAPIQTEERHSKIVPAPKKDKPLKHSAQQADEGKMSEVQALETPAPR